MVENKRKVGRPKEGKTPIPKTSLRLPLDLREAVERLAEKECRPVNSQIVYLLRKALEAENHA